MKTPTTAASAAISDLPFLLLIFAAGEILTFDVFKNEYPKSSESRLAACSLRLAAFLTVIEKISSDPSSPPETKARYSHTWTGGKGRAYAVDISPVWP